MKVKFFPVFICRYSRDQLALVLVKRHQMKIVFKTTLMSLGRYDASSFKQILDWDNKLEEAFIRSSI